MLILEEEVAARDLLERLFEPLAAHVVPFEDDEQRGWRSRWEAGVCPHGDDDDTRRLAPCAAC